MPLFHCACSTVALVVAVIAVVVAAVVAVVAVVAVAIIAVVAVVACSQSLIFLLEFFVAQHSYICYFGAVRFLFSLLNRLSQLR